MTEKIENQNNGTENGTATEPAKKGLLTRIHDGYRKTVLSVKKTRGGRIMIRVAKGAVVGLGLYGSYKLGQKSTVPTTVYIESGVDENTDTEESEAEEAVEETQDHD